MLSLGLSAFSVLLLALVFDLLLEPARRLRAIGWARIPLPERGRDLILGLPVRTRRILGGVLLGLALVFGLLLLFRFQTFLGYFPFGRVLIALAAASVIELRRFAQMLVRLRSGLGRGPVEIARDGLAAVLPWRAIGNDPAALARQGIEAGVIGFAVSFLTPALAFLIIGLPGPVLWRVLVALGSSGVMGRLGDRQFVRMPDRALMLLLFGPGWLAARLFALAGFLVRVRPDLTLDYVACRVRHGEQPLAPAMDAMAFLARLPLRRPVMARCGGTPGLWLGSVADVAPPGVAAATALRIFLGAVALVTVPVVLVAGLGFLLMS